MRLRENMKGTAKSPTNEGRSEKNDQWNFNGAKRDAKWNGGNNKNIQERRKLSRQRGKGKKIQLINLVKRINGGNKNNIQIRNDL
jgi:hypothetical protein